MERIKIILEFQLIKCWSYYWTRLIYFNLQQKKHLMEDYTEKLQNSIQRIFYSSGLVRDQQPEKKVSLFEGRIDPETDIYAIPSQVMSTPPLENSRCSHQGKLKS